MTATIHSITDWIPHGGEPNYSTVEDHGSARAALPLPMELEPSVAVFSSFLVSPGDAATWIHAWQKLATIAETWPGCRSFRIARDRNDDMYVAIFSEWDEIDTYRSFVRATGDLWLQGAVGRDIMPGESRYLEVL